MTSQDVLRKYPRIVAHMMCESLGYFTPLSAASALKSAIEGEACYCEWYMSMCRKDRSMEEVTKLVVQWAISRRRSHRGYMAEYEHAKSLVRLELGRAGATAHMLAGWF